MDAPQSKGEVEPVVRALKGMDHLLDLIWNPKAFMLERGSYSVLGQLIPPTYAGRWQVIRYDTPNLSPTRDYCVLCTVTQPVTHNGVVCLTEEGPYAPVGEWLVRYMQAADAANVRAATAMRARLWAAEEAIEHRHDAADDAMAAESLDHVHFHANYAGGVGNWQGKGAAFSPSAE